MPCNCGSKGSGGTYTVKLPDGRTKTATSELSAKMIAAQYPGATYSKAS